MVHQTFGHLTAAGVLRAEKQDFQHATGILAPLADDFLNFFYAAQLDRLSGKCCHNPPVWQILTIQGFSLEN
jgi:hypothetical protein